MNKILFAFLFLILKINYSNEENVINTCGIVGYTQPRKVDDCKEDDEVCCFVEIEDSTNGVRRFCVSSPSDIEFDDVKDDIKKYTGFTLKALKCNESQFIKNNILMIFALFVFMLFWFIILLKINYQ